MKTTEKEIEEVVINDWDIETLTRLFELQISQLKNKGFISEDVAKILEERTDKLMAEIAGMLPLSDISIPFVIIPNSGNPYYLTDVVCDRKLSEMIYKETRRIIALRGRQFLTEEELSIFEKVIKPLIEHPVNPEKESFDDSGIVSMREYWIYTTSYKRKISF